MLTYFKKIKTTVWVGLLSILLTGCATQEVGRLQSPLESRIFDPRTGSELSRDEFLTMLAASDVIYLGEQHGNKAHHQLQLEIITWLREQGLTPQIGLEVFSYDQSSTLLSITQLKNREHLNKGGFDTESWIRRKIAWDEKRDGSWDNYGAVIRYAYDQALPLFGIDLSKAIRHRITKLGAEGLTPVEKRMLSPTEFRDDVYHAMMTNKFKAAHCGWGEKSYLNRLYDNWLARNDTMAMAVTRMASTGVGPVVVIVGSGHTEYSLGAFDRVAHLNPRLKQVNLALVGVDPNATSVQPYLESHPFEGIDFGPRYEYVWLTEGSAPGEDRCKRFLDSKKNKRNG